MSDYSDAVLATSGLQYYWTLDGPTVADSFVADYGGVDLTSTNNPSVVAGPTHPGLSGATALNFDGTDDWAGVTNLTGGFSVMTVEMWYMWRGAGNSTDLDRLFSFGGAYAQPHGNVSDATSRFRMFGPGGGGVLNLPNTPVSSWIHGVFTWDTTSGTAVGKYRMWRDGIPVVYNGTAGSNNAAFTIPTANFILAASDFATAQWGPCRIAHVAIYNRALTLTEIHDHVNAALPDPDESGVLNDNRRVTSRTTVIPVGKPITGDI